VLTQAHVGVANPDMGAALAAVVLRIPASAAAAVPASAVSLMTPILISLCPHSVTLCTRS
jgi:hypothetical protein